MKTRVQNSSGFGSPSLSQTPSFYKYLKPGDLAQLRYSKITARSKQIGAQTMLALCQLESSSDTAIPQPHSNGLDMDVVPSFSFRVKSFPRCLGRKKLLAVAPVFNQT